MSTDLLDSLSENKKEEQKPTKKSYKVIVNGREKEVNSHKISYTDLVILAFGQVDESPNAVYTVTYSKGNNNCKGSIVKGDTITLKQGMIFNVTRTDKS